MSVPGVRTAVVAALVAAVGVRVSAADPVTGAVARIAHDPSAALLRAAEGWTVAGSLGVATAEGLREVPLAAFFWLTDVLWLPPTAGQAAWRVLVLLLALIGAVKLARTAMPRAATEQSGDVEPWTPWVAAVLYACGPVLLAAAVSAPLNGLVAASLPWLVVPLLGEDRGWRAAASSAACVGLAGVATPAWALTTLVAGALVAAPRSRRDVGQFARWLLLAVLASAWWLAALIWELRYAADLTALARASGREEGLRAALGAQDWPTVWLVLVLLGPVAVAVGSLVLRVGRHRLVVGNLVAAAAVTAFLPVDWQLPVLGITTGAATAGSWGPLLTWVWLAGLLAWCPVVEELRGRVAQPGSEGWSRERVAVAATAVVLVGAAAAGPVLSAREPAPAGVGADPTLWAGVEAWSESSPSGRVLVLPATVRGRLDDAVATALRDRPWVGRDTLPPSGTAATGALDEVLWRLARGQGGPGTAEGLKQLGISYVLLRGDVAASDDRERPVALARHALATLGATRTAVIESPDPDAPHTTTDAVQDFGVRSPLAQVEIWALPSNADGRVHASEPVPVVGGSGTASDLADAGLLDAAAVELVAAGTGPPAFVSDSARRRDVDQRTAVDPFGPVLTADSPRLVVPAGAAPITTAVRRLAGVSSVTASSSAADLGGSHRLAGSDPSAAVDGNTFTAWQSRRGDVVGQWWEIRFEGPTDLSTGLLQVVRNAFVAHRVTEVRLESDAGSSDLGVPDDGLVSLAPAGVTTRLRVVATAVEGMPAQNAGFGIAEVSVPGVTVRDLLGVIPSPTSTWLLAARPGSQANCVPAYAVGGSDAPGVGTAVCDRSITVEGPDSGSLIRVLPVDAATTVAGRVWTRAADGDTSGRLADDLARPSISVTGSSVASQDLVTRPQAAADADPATAWRPAPEDEAPTLELSWRGRADVSGVRLVPISGGVNSQVTRVQVTAEGEDADQGVTVEVGPDGLVSLPGWRTTGLTLTFLADSGMTSADSLTGGVRPVPAAVAEVEVVGGPAVRYDQDGVTRLECGSGPTVTVAGDVIETSIEVSAREVVEAAVVRATLCDRPTLNAGDVEVAVEASFSWVPLGLVLSPVDGPLGTVDSPAPEQAGAAPLATGVLDSPGSSAALTIGPETGDDRTITFAVPAGSGWTAQGGGRTLEPLVVDGWGQAWQVPAGVGEVTLDYSAGPELRFGVGLSVLGWLLVLALALPVSARASLRLRRDRRDQAIAGRSTHA